MSIELKPHNEETYEKIQQNFEKSNKTAVIQPTGTGKSFLALKLIEDNSDKKAIYIAPSNAILHNLKKTIFETGNNMTNFPNLKRITYQSLMNLSDEEIKELGADIIILDEFHHCGAPEWGSGINRLLENNSDAKVLGLSATPIRYFDQTRDMAEEMFNNNIASEMSLEEAVNNGILPKATYVSALYKYGEELENMQRNIDKIKNPEQKALAQELFERLGKQLDENTQNLPELLSKHMGKNGKYIVFCKTIEDMKEKIKESQSLFKNVNTNITTYAVSSKMRDNDETLSKFENDNDENTLKLMFAVNMLNEGYHIKDLDGVVMLRPTYSPTIYEQQFGRALTLKKDDGKEPIIIDLVNNFDSIKIIEDLCERLSQYDGTERNTGKSTRKSTISIYDTTRDFREIVEKISKFTRGNIVSLQEKLEIFDRYFEEGNGEIDGQTVFEGYPIGQWDTQIRYMVNRGNNGVNPTEEQYEKLLDLGILDSKIDSTIDEKIDALVEWYKEYPQIIVRGEHKAKLNKDTQEYLEEISRDNNLDSNELIDRYRKLQRYKKYVFVRAGRGKLSEKQIEKCKEGNIREIFGFPTKVEELAKKYQTDEAFISNICIEYGTMDNFLMKSRTGEALQSPLGRYFVPIFLNNLIDIDNNPNQKKYISFMECFYDFDRDFKIEFFSSKEIDKALEKLTSREAELIRQRYGLVDGKSKNFDSLGRMYGVRRERIRQIEAKAIRKLKKSIMKPVSIQDLKSNRYITDEEKTLLSKLEDDMWNSSFIFRNHDIRKDDKFDTDRLSIITDIKNKLIVREEERKNVAKKVRSDEELQSVSISDLNLSIRAYNCIMRAGINNVLELKNSSSLEKVRNLGKKSFDEVVNKMNEYGLAYKDGRFVEIALSEEETEIESNEQNFGEQVDSEAGKDEEIDDVADLNSDNGDIVKELDEENQNYNPNTVKVEHQEAIDESQKTKESTELEKLRMQKQELETVLKDLEEKTRKAKELLASYDKILDGDRTNPNNEEI